MSPRSKLFAIVLAGFVSNGAVADDYEAWLMRVGDYETLAQSWWSDAMFGNAEKQERLAELFLGPHALQAKAAPYEGIHLMFRAAVHGRVIAMRRLGAAVNLGLYGLSKRPDAAQCWLRTPATFEERLSCVRLTEFDDLQARVPCTELAVVEAMQHPEIHDGIAMAKLCIANKTPAILVPGSPPSPQQLRRVDQYAQHGIEWAITGDVYNHNFETFRSTFNQTITAALDNERGRGYLDRLSKRFDGEALPE